MSDFSVDEFVANFRTSGAYASIKRQEAKYGNIRGFTFDIRLLLPQERAERRRRFRRLKAALGRLIGARSIWIIPIPPIWWRTERVHLIVFVRR